MRNYYSDPTANAAIANIMREERRKNRAEKLREARKSMPLRQAERSAASAPRQEDARTTGQK